MKDIDYFKKDPKDTVYPEEERLQKKIEKKHDKFKKNARLRDVRRALLGNLEVGEDNRLKPCDGINLNWWGTADGSFGTRFFGIAHRSVIYSDKAKNKTQTVYKAAKAMEDIGRSLDFDTVYEGCACLIKHFFYRPVVLIFEYTDEDSVSHTDRGPLILTAYCGRDILTILSLRRALKLFDKQVSSWLHTKAKEDR